MPTPEEKARDFINAKLAASGWMVQTYREMDLSSVYYRGHQRTMRHLSMPKPFATVLFCATETCVVSWLVCALLVAPEFAQGPPTGIRVLVGAGWALHSVYFSYKHRTWVFALGGLIGLLLYALSVVLFVHYRPAR